MTLRIYNDPGHAHFLTFSCFRRRQFLANHYVRVRLAQSIESSRQKHDFALWAYVFMPEHIHLLIHPRRVNYSISEVLRDIKLPTARAWITHLHKTRPARLISMQARQGRRVVYRLWQAGGGYDRNLFNWKHIERAVDYIEWNPVTRGLVSDPKEWIWSSARARAGESDVPLTVDSFDVNLERSERVLSKP